MASGRTIWVDLLTDEERAVLHAGSRSHPSHPDVLVVGGGVLGVTTALACHRAGLGQVALIEAGELGSGSTAGAAGLLIPEAHQGSDPEAFVELARSSLGLWRELESGTPGGVGLRELEWIGFAPLSAGFLADPPSSVEWLSADDVAQLVPGLALETSGALIRHQGRVNPLRAVSRMASQLPHVVTGVKATRCEEKSGVVVGISTTEGPISPGSVIFATGGPPALAGLDVGVPSDFVKGHLAATAPVSLTLPGSVAQLATQIEDGRLLVGGTVDADDLTPGVNAEVLEGVRQQLLATWPQLRDRRAYPSVVLLAAPPPGQPARDRPGAGARTRGSRAATSAPVSSWPPSLPASFPIGSVRDRRRRWPARGA